MGAIRLGTATIRVHARVPLAAAAAIALVGLCLLWSSIMTPRGVDEDGAVTLRMAVNLAHHGVVSKAAEAPYAPSMYREPVPVLVTAGAVALSDALFGRTSWERYRTGWRVRWLKHVNIIWMVVLCASAYWAARELTGSALVGLVAAVALNFDFLPLGDAGLRVLDLDSLRTEAPAAALLMTGSAALLSAWRGGRVSRYALAGLCFGLLTLTKAAFLYVFIGLAGGLAVLALLALPRGEGRGRAPPRGGAPPLRPDRRGVAALAAAFFVVVLPWMARNEIELGRFQVSERGGMVLYIRALEDGMTWQEFRGGFYVWAPAQLRPLLGRVLGFSRRDLERGGRLQRLNRASHSNFAEADLAAETAGRPGDALTYYREARAERERLRRLAAAAGQRNAEPAIDAALEADALGIIAAHPFRHAVMTLLFLWRGAFFALPLLVAEYVYAARRRDAGLAVFLAAAAGSVAFYALVSHFIPRYSAPTLPLLVVALLAVGAKLLEPLFAGGGAGRRPSAPPSAAPPSELSGRELAARR